MWALHLSLLRNNCAESWLAKGAGQCSACLTKTCDGRIWLHAGPAPVQV